MSSSRFRIEYNSFLVRGDCSYGPITNIIEFTAVVAAFLNGLCFLLMKNNSKIGLMILVVFLGVCISASVSMFI